MSLYPYSGEIDDILAGEGTVAPKARIIFDRYTALPSAVEREAFVLALIAELLARRARFSGHAQPSSK